MIAFFLGLLGSPVGRALVTTAVAIVAVAGVLLGAVQYGKMQERHRNELLQEQVKTASRERDLRAAEEASAAAEVARKKAATEAATERSRLNVLRGQLAAERARRSKLPECAAPGDIGRRLREFRGD